MLTKAKRRLLNNGNNAILNSKNTTTIFIQDTHKNVVIV